MQLPRPQMPMRLIPQKNRNKGTNENAMQVLKRELKNCNVF